MKPRTHTLSFLLLLLVLFTGAVIGVTVMKSPQDIRSRASATGSKLALSPAAKTATIGDTVSVGLTINTGSDTVSAAELHLTYDPAAIQILNFTPGTLLPVVLTPESHTNGTISVTLGVNPATPFKGAGIVGTWTVKILAAIQSSIKIANTTQVAAIGKTTNALAGSTESVITGKTQTDVGTTPTQIPTEKPANTPTKPPAMKPTSKPSDSATVKPTTKPSLLPRNNTPVPTKRITQTRPTNTPIPQMNPTSEIGKTPSHVDKISTSPENKISEVSKTAVLDQIINDIIGFLQNLFQPREE